MNENKKTDNKNKSLLIYAVLFIFIIIYYISIGEASRGIGLGFSRYQDPYVFWSIISGLSLVITLLLIMYFSNKKN